MENTQKYLTTQEIAEYFDVTPRTVQNWMRSGIVTKYEKHGPRRVRFLDPQAIEEIKKPNTQNAGNE